MPYSKPDALVSTDWLAQHLSAPDVRVVDATYFLPGSDRDARAEYNERHIPGAVFFDIDEISDTSSSLPHMLPAPEKFTSRVRKLGLGDGVRIVVYDTHGLMSAARVWWMSSRLPGNCSAQTTAPDRRSESSIEVTILRAACSIVPESA